ncbi:MAG: hypothetical protein JO142_05545 [Burkholderiales bacterium]|nr:hypothetical protein [Burkholderiales bacterium]
MLKLNASERQSLVGPLVIGCLLGAFVALASWGFDSEYSHIDRWRMTLNAVADFVVSVAIAMVPLGILPIAIRRLHQRLNSAPDGEGHWDSCRPEAEAGDRPLWSCTPRELRP